MINPAPVGVVNSAATSKCASGTPVNISAVAGAGMGYYVQQLECQIDDMTAESLGFLLQALFNKGALDVYYTPIIMKKSRPATLITMICS